MRVELLVQRRPRRFSKQSAIPHRETTKLPEAMFHGDCGDRCRSRVGKKQRPICQVHPPKPEVAARAHAQMFLATKVESSSRNPQIRTNFREICRSVAIGRQPLLEA